MQYMSRVSLPGLTGIGKFILLYAFLIIDGLRFLSACPPRESRPKIELRIPSHLIGYNFYIQTAH